jgi:hypothetical protein
MRLLARCSSAWLRAVAWVASATVLAGLAAALMKFAPKAAGSGIPLFKAHLDGAFGLEYLWIHVAIQKIIQSNKSIRFKVVSSSVDAFYFHNQYNWDPNQIIENLNTNDVSNNKAKEAD